MFAEGDQADVVSAGCAATVSNIVCLVKLCLFFVLVYFNVW